MILIWGFKARLKTLAEGGFHCPNCGVDRPYRHREARRWFTFFWIPLIPLKVLGTFIECTVCSSSYDEQVLGLPTNASLADNLSIGLRGLIVAVLRADGSITEPERARAVGIVATQVNHAYGPPELEADLSAFAGHPVAEALGELSASLTEIAKEGLIEAAVEVARADGPVSDAEVAVINEAGAALLMTPAHVRGVIAQVLERA